MDHDLGPEFKGKIHDPHLLVKRQMEEMRASRSGEMAFTQSLPETVRGHQGRIERLEADNASMKAAINKLIERANAKSPGEVLGVAFMHSRKMRIDGKPRSAWSDAP